MSNREGWVCPRCKKVNAPWMPTCNCKESRAQPKTSEWRRGFGPAMWELYDDEAGFPKFPGGLLLWPT